MLIATALGVLALIPGVYARWSSRHLLRHLEDPLLPDRLIAHSRRVGTAAGIVIGLGAAVFTPLLPVLLFLTWVSVLAGGFRARKAVFDESWRFPSYFLHIMRFWLGLVGPFALIAAIPWAMVPFETSALTAGIAAGGVAWLWVLVGARMFRWLVRARPLDGAEADALSPLFSRVLQNAKCAAPALFVAEAPGGSWVNAFAFPAVGRPGVLFTRGLLAALTPGETAAIFAHEIAHLEHFRPKKVLLGRVFASILVVLPVFLWGGPLSDLLRGFEWIWPLAFVIAFAARARASRGHEAESDRRALELSGDAESLVSGLVKLHSLNRLSRRWDAAYESLSTHPSLARRIRGIQAVSGKRVPVALQASFRAADGSDRAVQFDASRIHWLRGLPEEGEDLLARSGSRESHRYEDLLELRLRGGRELVMKGKGGESGRMEVRAEDVTAIEEVLDKVDVLLSDAPPAAAAPTGELWSIVLGVLGLIPKTSWVLAALAGTALARPSFTALLALGAAGLASALALPDPWWRSTSLALAGVASVSVAFRARGLPRTRTEVRLAILVPLVLVALSGLGGVRALLSSLPAMHASLWASESPSAFVGLVAIGAALASFPRARLLAALAFASALGIALVGTSAFREKLGGDLFGAPGAPIPSREVSLAALREVAFPGGAFRLLLSPRGGRVGVALAAVESDWESDYLVESAPGRHFSMRAVALEYVDEGRILVLSRNGDRAELKIQGIDGESSDVLHDLPLLAGVELDWDPSGMWQVTGFDWLEGAFVLLRGSFDDDAPPSELRFSSEDERSTVVAVSPEMGALVARYDEPELASFALFASPRLTMALSLEKGTGSGTRLGESILSPNCFRRPSFDAGFYCIAADENRTGFFSLAPESPSFEPLGFVSGVLYGREVAPGGRLVLNPLDDAPLLVDLERRAALRPRNPDLRGAILAWQGEVLAAARVNADGDETKVTLYTVRE